MASPQKLVVSLTVPSSASTTTYGTAFAGFNSYDAIKGVAALQGLTGGTLNVYLQHSFDDGTTWYDCVAFPQLSAAASLRYYDFSMVLDSTIRTIGAGTVSAATPSLTVNTVTSGPWGPLIRLVSVSGSGTSGASKAQTVTFLSWQQKK